MEEINVAVFLSINHYAGKHGLLDAILIVAAENMPYFFIGVLIYLWFSGGMERKISSFNAGLSVLLAMLTSYIIALFYYQSRPFVGNLGTQLVAHAPDSSFPSDHTTFMFAIAIMLLFSQSTRTIGIILCVLSVIGGFSRIFVGVHYPFDIVGAVFVGLFSSVVVFKIQERTRFLMDYCIKIIPSKVER